MNCNKTKPSLKLTSNIMLSSRISVTDSTRYKPFDTLQRGCFGSTPDQFLSQQQITQKIKMLFWAREIRDIDTPFYTLPFNSGMCENCPEKDICY